MVAAFQKARRDKRIIIVSAETHHSIKISHFIWKHTHRRIQDLSEDLIQEETAAWRTTSAHSYHSYQAIVEAKQNQEAFFKKSKNPEPEFKMAEDAPAAAAQNQLIEAQHQLESSKLPFFHADPKQDKFSVEQWVHREDLARAAGNWDEKKTSEAIYRALRDEALTWYEGLEFSRVDNKLWASVRAAVLKNYGATATARTAILSFGDLNQKKNESINTY